MKVERIYRLFRLVTLLQSGHHYTAAELAEALEVSRRTVFRDLKALELARVPYYFDTDAGTYRLGEGFFLPAVNLTLPEALAVLALAGRMEKIDHVPLLSHSAMAAAKISSVLPEAIREQAGRIVDSLSVQLGPVAQHDGVRPTFDALASAIVRRRVCEIDYERFTPGTPGAPGAGTAASAGKVESLSFTIRPLRMIFLRRAWYLLAWSVADKGIRTFKVIRFRGLRVTKQTFPDTHSEALRTHFGEAWMMIPEGQLHKIHLRFTPKVAGNVEEVQWHESQKTTRREDGSLDFHVEVDGLGEIGWWILGYGDQVKVLKPKTLVKRIAATARSMVAQYDSPAESV